MVKSYERWITNSVLLLYPEREWIPRAVAFGRSIRKRMARYRIDPSLINTRHLSLIQLVRATYAYARYETYRWFDKEVEETAKEFFIHCYFLRLQDAEDYFRLVYFPRYFIQSISMTLKDTFRYLGGVIRREREPYLTLSLANEVVYHEQIGDWIPYEEAKNDTILH